jgi:YD repeat-containing protein
MAKNLADGELFSCRAFSKLAKAATILTSPSKFHRNVYAFALLCAFLCAGVSQADTVQRRVAAGLNHSLTLKEDGTLWSWGYNYYGQLGIGSTVDQWFPAQVTALSNVVAGAGGAYHSVAAKSDGTVWTWGYNGYGQIGDGTTTNRSTPVQVSGLANVVAVAAGDYHTVALKSDGTVWAWGYNGYGQLGDGTTTNRSTPVQVSGLTGVTALAAGQ